MIHQNLFFLITTFTSMPSTEKQKQKDHGIVYRFKTWLMSPQILGACIYTTLLIAIFALLLYYQHQIHAIHLIELSNSLQITPLTPRKQWLKVTDYMTEWSIISSCMMRLLVAKEGVPKEHELMGYTVNFKKESVSKCVNDTFKLFKNMTGKVNQMLRMGGKSKIIDARYTQRMLEGGIKFYMNEMYDDVIRLEKKKKRKSEL